MTSRLGPYELGEVLGRGGFGAVYRARHLTNGTECAVKVLHAALDAENVERFRREAQALARVGGEAALVVYETGVTDGRLWVALELAVGGSLADRLAAGTLSPEEAARLGALVARAVARCHAAGLVHRDLKPANVLFDAEGRPKLADFGIVRDLAASALTASGTVIGSPAFMPPEGLDGARGTPAGDVWAVGAIVHALLTGLPPYGAGQWHEILARIQKGKRAPLDPSVPRALVAAIDGALSLEASKRPSATELAIALERAEDAPEAGGRGPLVLALLLGGVLAFAAALGGAVLARRSRDGGGQPPPPPPPVPARDDAAVARDFERALASHDVPLELLREAASSPRALEGVAWVARPSHAAVASLASQSAALGLLAARAALEEGGREARARAIAALRPASRFAPDSPPRRLLELLESLEPLDAALVVADDPVNFGQSLAQRRLAVGDKALSMRRAERAFSLAVERSPLAGQGPIVELRERAQDTLIPALLAHLIARRVAVEVSTPGVSDPLAQAFGGEPPTPALRLCVLYADSRDAGEGAEFLRKHAGELPGWAERVGTFEPALAAAIRCFATVQTLEDFPLLTDAVAEKALERLARDAATLERGAQAAPRSDLEMRWFRTASVDAFHTLRCAWWFRASVATDDESWGQRCLKVWELSEAQARRERARRPGDKLALRFEGYAFVAALDLPGEMRFPEEWRSETLRAYPALEGLEHLVRGRPDECLASLERLGPRTGTERVPGVPALEAAARRARAKAGTSEVDEAEKKIDKLSRAEWWRDPTTEVLRSSFWLREAFPPLRRRR